MALSAVPYPVKTSPGPFLCDRSGTREPGHRAHVRPVLAPRLLTSCWADPESTVGLGGRGAGRGDGGLRPDLPGYERTVSFLTLVFPPDTGLGQFGSFPLFLAGPPRPAATPVLPCPHLADLKRVPGHEVTSGRGVRL